MLHGYRRAGGFGSEEAAYQTGSGHIVAGSCNRADLVATTPTRQRLLEQATADGHSQRRGFDSVDNAMGEHCAEN
jgi:hypothetical protein